MSSCPGEGIVSLYIGLFSMQPLSLCMIPITNPT